MYTKYSPCIHCAKYVIACGVKRVVIGQVYRNPQALDMMKETGVRVDLYQENPGWQKELIQLFSEAIPSHQNEGIVKMEVKNG